MVYLPLVRYGDGEEDYDAEDVCSVWVGALLPLYFFQMANWWLRRWRCFFHLVLRVNC